MQTDDLADAVPAPALISARQAGYVSCVECGQVNMNDASHCLRCGFKLTPRTGASIGRAWAWLLAGIICYIPANISPMLITNLLGRESKDTIYGGVVTLFEHGEYFIAFIVGFASICVPVFKFLVIGWLLLMVQFAQRPQPHIAHWLYVLVEYIGRWSMIDVFVVAVLCALVQMGFAASFAPGPATLSFALSVVFTMVSAQTVDQKLIWDAARGDFPGHIQDARKET